MSRRAFVLVIGTSEATVPLQIRMALEYWLDNATDGQIQDGIVTWPDAEGDTYLLPAVVCQ